MIIFYWYVIKEHLAPFIFAAAVILFILVLKLMLDMMDLLITQGVGIVILGKLLMYNLAWMVALVVPMSVLVATVMAFGRMGASGEIIAMKAAGISMYRIVAPIVILGCGITYMMIWFNNVVLPEANFRASGLQKAIKLKRPMLMLKNFEGQFVNEADIPFTFHVDDVDDETEELKGVTLFRREDGNEQTITTAEVGRFIMAENELTLLLRNGEIHRRDSAGDGRYIRSRFDTFTYIVRDISFGFNMNQPTSRNDRTATTEMMRADNARYRDEIESRERNMEAISKDSSTYDAQIRSFEIHINSLKQNISKNLVEIHKKNSIPFAALVFILIGSSLGILVKRSGASIGIGLSIGFFTLYYMFLIGGESAGDRMFLPAWLAMWLPNLLLGGLGAAMFVYAARR